MKNLNLILIFSILTCYVTAQSTFLTPKSFQTGLYFGTESYLQNTSSTNPSLAKIKSDYLFPINQDNKAFGGFFEIENQKNWIIRANLGYTELNDNVWYANSRNFIGGSYFGGKTSSYLNAGLQLGYNLKIKNLEIIPYAGASGNFGFGNITTNAGQFQTDGVFIENFNETEKSTFLTLDVGLRLRYWIKNFGIEFASGYSHGFGGLSNSNGNFIIDGQSGTFSGTRSGSKIYMSLGVLYRFGNK